MRNMPAGRGLYHLAVEQEGLMAKKLKTFTTFCQEWGCTPHERRALIEYLVFIRIRELLRCYG